MKRILQVFGKLDRGGAETMIMNYYRNINREDIQFDFVVNFTDKGAYEDEILSLGGNIYRLPRFKGYNIFSYAATWWKFLKSHPEWDVIHVHNFKIAGIIFPIAKMLGIECRIVHMHTANANYSFLKRIGYYTTKFLANRWATDRFACGDDAGKSYFGKREFTVMNNAIDAKKFSFKGEAREAKRSELQIEDKFIVGHIGNFSTPKNHPFIIDIFKEVHTQNSNTTLLLVGAGELMDSMKQRVAEAGLSDSVIFTGSRPDVPELMQAMDVFLFPSLWEGLPVSVVEAQAAGLTVVMSDRITDKVAITPLVEILSLDDAPALWVEKILTPKERTDSYEAIRKAGYDIEENVKWLEKFYTDGE